MTPGKQAILFALLYYRREVAEWRSKVTSVLADGLNAWLEKLKSWLGLQPRSLPDLSTS